MILSYKDLVQFFFVLFLFYGISNADENKKSTAISLTPTSQKGLDKIQNDEPQEPFKLEASNRKQEKRRRKKISNGNSDIDAKVKTERRQISNDVPNIEPSLDKKRKVVETVEKSDINSKSKKEQEQTSDDKLDIDPRFNSGQRQISNDMPDIEPRLEKKPKLKKIKKKNGINRRSKKEQYETSKEKLDIDPMLNGERRQVLNDVSDIEPKLNSDQLQTSNEWFDIEREFWTRHDKMSNDKPDINSRLNSGQRSLNDKDYINQKLGSSRKQALNHHLTNVNVNYNPRLTNPSHHKKSDRGLSYTEETINKSEKRPSISQIIKKAVTQELDDLDNLINVGRFPPYGGTSPIQDANRIINEDLKIKQIPVRYTRETFEIMKGIAPAMNIYKWLTENNILELLGKVTNDLDKLSRLQGVSNEKSSKEGSAKKVI